MSIPVPIIVSLLEVMLTKGLPAVADIMVAWQKEDPTFQDIDKLHDIVKNPRKYFE